MKRSQEFLLCRDVLNECPQRVAYYPGSADKFNKVKKAFSGVEELGCQPTQTDSYRTHPWMLKTGLTPEEVRAAFWTQNGTDGRHTLL